MAVLQSLQKFGVNAIVYECNRYRHCACTLLSWYTQQLQVTASCFELLMSGHAWILSVLRLTRGHVSVSEVDRVMNNCASAASVKRHLEPNDVTLDGSQAV